MSKPNETFRHTSRRIIMSLHKANIMYVDIRSVKQYSSSTSHITDDTVVQSQTNSTDVKTTESNSIRLLLRALHSLLCLEVAVSSRAVTAVSYYCELRFLLCTLRPWFHGG